MRVYRILLAPEPTRDDFTSLLSQGRPVPKGSPPMVQRKWGAVSTFTTLELASKRAREKNLGAWWAALDLPPDVEVEEDPPPRLGRHVSIYGATPEQLLDYVAEVGQFESEEVVE
jgi:hypothetical protein